MPLSPKDPEEKFNIIFDFSKYYSSITNPVVSCFTRGTLTNNPSMIESTSIYSNNKVVCLIGGGEDGVKYDLRCKVDTNTNETVVIKDVLSVKVL